MNKGRKEYIFQWFIENYSFCCHKNGKALISPEFIFDGMDGTAWWLELYPRGDREEAIGYVSLHLTRSESNGPESFPLEYELAFLAADGSVLQSRTIKYAFSKGGGYGCPNFLSMDEVLLRRKVDYLPQDTLSVCCRMWKDEGDIERVMNISAKTHIGIEKISFLHVMEGFSSLELNQKKTILIRPSTKGLALSSSVHFTDDSCYKGKIVVDVTSSDTNRILSMCKLSLLNNSGEKIESGEADNRYDCTRKEIQKLPLSLTRAVILNRKSEFLSDDKLFLLCECVFSSGVKYKNIERILYDVPSEVLHHVNNHGKNKVVYDATEKLTGCRSALDDLKAIYIDKLLTDVQLKSKTKSFPVHKLLLCARSSVFKTMLTNDMKEKNTDLIEVDDIDDDILQQFLLFLYSDNVDQLQWESAMKLYYVADKYEVEKLKTLCSCFLVDHLNTWNASELLLLADTHNDSNLKKVVEDFIFKHEVEIFGSEEWRHLMEINPLLVSKTMCLKYIRKV